MSSEFDSFNESDLGGFSESALKARGGGGEFGFIVTAPANIIRGNAFDITIQSFLLADNSLDTSFVPAGNVDISLVAITDASDAISPLFTDNTGWSSGKKTVSVTIDGGSGTDTENIKADDSDSGRTGSTDLVVNDPTISQINFIQARVFDSGLQLISSTPNAANWLQVQNDAQVAFDADTTLAFVTANSWLRSVQRVTTTQVRSQIQSGFMKFTFNNPSDKTGVLAAKVRLRLASIENDDFSSGPFRYSPNANTREFRIKSSENATLFASGAALRAMSPDKTYNFTQINDKNILAGAATPASRFPAVDIELELDASVIAGMAGNDLYVWFYIHAFAAIPFASPFSDVDSDTPEAHEVTDFLAAGSTIKLLLFK